MSDINTVNILDVQGDVRLATAGGGGGGASWGSITGDIDNQTDLIEKFDEVETSIPTKTSDLTNDSGFISSIPSQYITETELTSALSTKADTSSIPTKTSQLTNDSGYITSVPVNSVNGKTGTVVLNASDVGALASNTAYVSSVNGSSGAVTISVPTKTSDLQNDSGFLTSAVTTFNGQSGAVTYSAPVSSVNGQTGAVTGLQTTSNLVTSVSSASTDTQYPSAKCLYDMVGNIEALLSAI